MFHFIKFSWRKSRVGTGVSSIQLGWVFLHIPTVRVKLFRRWEDGRVMVHQVRLRRYHRAFGEVVAFDRAAACGDEAGLVSFDCFNAVRETGWCKRSESKKEEGSREMLSGERLYSGRDLHAQRFQYQRVEER